MNQWQLRLSADSALRRRIFNLHSLRHVAVLTVLFGWQGTAATAQPARELPPFPVEPTFPQAPALDLVTPPRIPLEASEIMLEGVVLSVSPTQGELIMQVTSFTLPNGRQSTIDEPRFKTIHFDPKVMIAAAPYPADGAAPQWVSSRLLWPMLQVAVVGIDSGTGNDMTANLIEMGGKARLKGLEQPASPRTVFFNGVPEHVAGTGLRVGQAFGITDIGGKAARGKATSDHPRGLALDFMVGRNSTLGDAVASYFEANAGIENVRYIIWKDHLVYPGARTDWAKLAVDYGPGMTVRHMDHVHVSFLEKPTIPGPYLTDEMLSKAKVVPAKLSSRSGRRPVRRR